MSKFKPVRRKTKGVSPAVARGLPCIVLLASAFVLAMLFMYFVMKYSAQ